MRFFKSLHYLSVFLLLVLAGCTNPFGEGPSIVNRNYGPIIEPVVAPTGIETTAGAHFNATTANLTHRTSLSVGATVEPLKVVTSQNKILYLTVQGQMNSGQ